MLRRHYSLDAKLTYTHRDQSCLQIQSSLSRLERLSPRCLSSSIGIVEYYPWLMSLMACDIRLIDQIRSHFSCCVLEGTWHAHLWSSLSSFRVPVHVTSGPVVGPYYQPALTFLTNQRYGCQFLEEAHLAHVLRHGRLFEQKMELAY